MAARLLNFGGWWVAELAWPCICIQTCLFSPSFTAPHCTALDALLRCRAWRLAPSRLSASPRIVCLA